MGQSIGACRFAKDLLVVLVGDKKKRSPFKCTEALNHSSCSCSVVCAAAAGFSSKKSPSSIECQRAHGEFNVLVEPLHIRLGWLLHSSRSVSLPDCSKTQRSPVLSATGWGNSSPSTKMGFSAFGPTLPLSHDVEAVLDLQPSGGSEGVSSLVFCHLERSSSKMAAAICHAARATVRRGYR